MRISPTWSLPLVLAFAACAPQTFRADAGAMFAKIDGEVGLQNAGGTLVLHDNMNDLGAFGVDDTETAPYLRLQWDHEQHRVRGHFFGFDAAGTGVLTGDFGGILAGSVATAAMEFYASGVAYSYGVVQNQDFRLGLGGQFGLYMLDLAARTPSRREEVETDVLVPMPFVDAEVYLGDVVTIGGNAGLMVSELRDADGRFWDVEAWARLQATKEIEFLVGYRFLLMDAHGIASSRDFDSDLTLQGLFVGGGITF
ncbi:MAG: hypothetical protein FJ265_08305 [Planctomycetes bacterium]|nr:hypothetical protein [Planctomycetota bacterium]